MDGTSEGMSKHVVNNHQPPTFIGAIAARKENCQTKPETAATRKMREEAAGKRLRLPPALKAENIIMLCH